MRKTIFGSLKRRVSSVAPLVAVGVLGLSAVAAADTLGSINFESYAPGNINTATGWSKTGLYDANVVNTGRYGFGRALQISNAVASGSFGDQTFSPGLNEPAGESAQKHHFKAEFKIGTTSDVMQEGLKISVSPDSGQGGRMSYLRFEDQANGVDVYFDDFTKSDFKDSKIGTLSRTSAHTIKFEIEFKKGADEVKILIDGKKKASGTTWEKYYNSTGEQEPQVSKMLFRAGGDSVPDTRGNGFLIDNLTLESS